MQYQDPHRNSPFNPLIKVASLDLEKIVQPQNSGRGKIIARVTFKKSDAMTGTTIDKEGRSLFLTFSMALRKAEFELVFQDSEGRSANGLVTLSRVAYIQPLATSVTVKSSDKKKRSSHLEGSISGEAGAKPTAVGLIPNAKASAIAAASSKTTADHSISSTVAYKNLNVQATFAGNLVHWEVRPAMASASVGKDHLQGGLFVKNGGLEVAACHVNKKDQSSLTTICAKGSLYVDMSDVVIDNFAVTDEDGEAASMSGNLLTSAVDYISNNELKKRLFKQVIRKHLSSQGMNARAQRRVEISRAET